MLAEDAMSSASRAGLREGERDRQFFLEIPHTLRVCRPRTPLWSVGVFLWGFPLPAVVCSHPAHPPPARSVFWLVFFVVVGVPRPPPVEWWWCSPFR